jgi:uncharacterized lipoprotein YddW (UPF0748 family)
MSSVRALLPAAGLFALCLTIATCSTFRPGREVPSDHDFRGVWVATVNNIDWPSRRDLSVEEQKRELIAILDRVAALRLNAVMLQVRPAADALYASPFEPWSEYLTGQMGRAPEPLYDPLAFAVAEAHARGLQLHAWFNPLRAHHPSGTSPIDAQHISRIHPELVRRYGRYLWLDPGEDAVRRWSEAVILDVVRRYDVDGVHIDDYFYPYPERDARGAEIEFPDDGPWSRYLAAGGAMSRADWRRDNINQFVRELYTQIKATRPAVQFGISPFGIWRPGWPQQISGLDAYASIYADSKLWLQEGWVDYLAPQLYWPIGKPQQSFPVLLHWWTAQSTCGRPIWPGMSVSHLASRSRPKGWPAAEIAEQMRIARTTRGAGGFILFSMRALMEDRDGVDAAVVAELPPRHTDMARK